MAVDYLVSWTPSPGSYGTLIEYKLSSATVWITPSSAPNPTTLTSYTLSLTEGNTYDIRLSSVYPNCIKKYKYLTVTVAGSSGGCCPVDYTLSPDETYCYKEEETAPTVTQSGICLVPSPLAGQYSGVGTCLYDASYDIHLNGAYTLLTTTPQWKESPGQILGPMNRDSVWTDTDCNGTKDPLTSGAVVNISHTINLTAAKTVYIGIGGDNRFKLVLNGTVIVDCNLINPAQGGANSSWNFNYWYLFPVDLVSGPNQLNFQAVGDGTTNDSFAAVVYDNTSAQLAAATSDSELNILFHTRQLVTAGTQIDIATCPSGYWMDTSGGSGAYVCRRILTNPTIPCE